VLVAAAAAGTAGSEGQGHRGGTLRLLSEGDGGPLDPQINWVIEYWQLYQATYDGLVAFRKTSGAASYAVVPDLAVSIPKPSNGGRTWVFRLRNGIRFSDGTAVTPADVAASFRRIYEVNSPTAGPYYSGIVGAAACRAKPRACTLRAGVVPDERAGTVTVNLTAPDPELLYRLALPTASVLPAETPSRDQGSKPIPGTGPYAFTVAKPGKELVLERNRYFHEWSHAAQPDGYPDRIVYRFGVDANSEVTEMENDQADWVFDQLPADRLPELASRYSQRVHVNRIPILWYVELNMHLPPFDSLRARQAFNYAVDRRAAVKLKGGPRAAIPTCQVLPAGFPGHRDYCPYERDLAKAKRLVEESGTAGQKVTLLAGNDAADSAMGDYLQSVLRDLGYRASLRKYDPSRVFALAQNTKNKVQLSLTQWFPDYPAPSGFLYALYSCASFHPGSDSSVNMAGFCDHALDARMVRAQRLALTDPVAANEEWARIDRAVTDAAPLVALFDQTQIDFISSRVGHFVFSNQWHWLIDQSWVQ
jgi:peptide/nickel transport system substrate-binding protein